MKVLTLSTSPIKAPSPLAPTVMSRSQNLPAQPLLTCRSRGPQPGESNPSCVTVTAVVCSCFCSLEWIVRWCCERVASTLTAALPQHLRAFPGESGENKTERMKDECERSRSLRERTYTHCCFSIFMYFTLTLTHSHTVRSHWPGVFTSDLLALL